MSLDLGEIQDGSDDPQLDSERFIEPSEKSGTDQRTLGEVRDG